MNKKSILNSTTKDFCKVLFICAITVRLLALLVVFTFTPGMSVGFLSDSYLQNDDVRYETGGIYYAETADSVLDKEAFTAAYVSVRDYVGYKLGNPFESLSLWHWMVCIILYFTKNVIFVRLLNVVLSSIACVVVYKFAEEASSKHAAKVTAGLLAFLPYPVFFSCFAYRDHLIMLLTFLALYEAARFHNNGAFENIGEWFLLGFSIVVMLMLRSGLPIILLAVCLFIMFEDKLQRISIQYYFLMLIGICITCLIFIKYNSVIFLKFKVYISNRSIYGLGGGINQLNINGIKDLYKLPFTYLFSVIMPIELNKEIGSWAQIIGHINIIMVYIAVGSLLFLFQKKKNNPAVYWSCLAYYLVSIIASLGIFRHYFSLLPIVYLAFAEFFINRDAISKATLYSLGTAYGFSLIAYYYFLAV